MDPATIFQIVGTVVSLGDIVIKCIARLSTLKAQFHDAPIIVTSMIGQLHMVKIAQDQLSTLGSTASTNDPRYHQLATHIGNALDSFSPILLALGQQLDRYEGIGIWADRMAARTRLGFLNGEREMTNLSILLDRQVNALNLLLQAIQCATWTQQSEVITREESQSILRLAKDCSSSLLGFGDVASFISETTAAISTRFEFDDVLRSTVLYQTAERSHLKQAIQAKRTNIKRISTDNTSRRSTISGTRHAFPRIKLSQPIKENDVLDNQQGNRLNSQSELTVDPSRGNGSGRDKDPPQQNLVNDSKQPTRPPLNKSESSFGHWRRALQRRISSATDIKPYQNQQDGNSQPEGTKVLLLGVSGCGKTTLINALHLFAGTDHITNNGGHYRAMIWQNALDAVGILFKEPLLKQIFHNWHLLYTYPALVPKEARQLASAIVNSRRSVNFQLELKASTDYQFENNAKYYIENIDRLAEQAIHLSAPTHGDVLRTRVTTTGINQTVLEYGGTQYLLHDVGGDSRKLKGWVGAYEHVATIIFPVDIIGYRREVGVGIYVDRMQEQINLWKSVVNNRWFKNASFLVVFTRMDLINKYLKLEETRYSLSKRGVLTTVEDYLGYLEEMFSKLIDWRHITDEPWQVRVRFVRANYNKGR